MTFQREVQKFLPCASCTLFRIKIVFPLPFSHLIHYTSILDKRPPFTYLSASLVTPLWFRMLVPKAPVNSHVSTWILWVTPS